MTKYTLSSEDFTSLMDRFNTLAKRLNTGKLVCAAAHDGLTLIVQVYYRADPDTLRKVDFLDAGDVVYAKLEDQEMRCISDAVASACRDLNLRMPKKGYSYTPTNLTYYIKRL